MVNGRGPYKNARAAGFLPSVPPTALTPFRRRRRDTGGLLPPECMKHALTPVVTHPCLQMAERTRILSAGSHRRRGRAGRRSLAAGLVLVLGCLVAFGTQAQGASQYEANFSNAEPQRWTGEFELRADPEGGGKNSFSLACRHGSDCTLVSSGKVQDPGMLEVQVRTESKSVRVQVSVSTARSLNEPWSEKSRTEVQVGKTYTPVHLAIDDVGAHFVKLHLSAANPGLLIDSISIARISFEALTSVAASESTRKMLDAYVNNSDNQALANSLRDTGRDYVAQIDTQATNIARVKAILATFSLADVVDARMRMANPIAYKGFRENVETARQVASPMQQLRLNSLLKPLGDIATGVTNVITGGVYSAIAEPLKSTFAVILDETAWGNRDIGRSVRKDLSGDKARDSFMAMSEMMDQFSSELAVVEALSTTRGQVSTQGRELVTEFEDGLKRYLGIVTTPGSPQYASVFLSDDHRAKDSARAEIRKFFDKAASGGTPLVLQLSIQAGDKLRAASDSVSRYESFRANAKSYYSQLRASLAPSRNPFVRKADREEWEALAATTRVKLKVAEAAFDEAFGKK